MSVKQSIIELLTEFAITCARQNVQNYKGYHTHAPHPVEKRERKNRGNGRIVGNGEGKKRGPTTLRIAYTDDCTVYIMNTNIEKNIISILIFYTWQISF